MKKYLITLFALAAVSLAHAAGFDCTKASTLVEKEICADPTLSRLDDALNIDHEVVMNSLSNLSIDVAREKLSGLSREQTAWLKERNRCTSGTCLESSYRKRIHQLCDQMKPYREAGIVQTCRSQRGTGGVELEGIDLPD